MDVAEQLRQGVQHIRNGNGTAAHTVLQSVLNNPAFQAATDFDDIKARTFSLFAQSQLLIRDFEGAKNSVQTAMSLARTLDDSAGLKHLRSLSRQIEIEHMVAQRDQYTAPKRGSKIPISELLNCEESIDAQQHLLTQATLYITDGDTVHLPPLLDKILGWKSIDVKTKVITLLMKAQVDNNHGEEILLQAWNVADEANDFNLLQAVAKTAEQLGHTIGTLHGPQMTE